MKNLSRAILVIVVAELIGFSYMANVQLRQKSKMEHLYHYYQSIGYSNNWAMKRALVESGITPPDLEYTAIIED